jgi:hypothetical protein
MLCYSVEQRDVPHRVSRDDIRAAFADGWWVDSIEPAVIDTTVHPSGASGWLARLTRLAADPSAASAPSAPSAQANRNEGPT